MASPYEITNLEVLAALIFLSAGGKAKDYQRALYVCRKGGEFENPAEDFNKNHPSHYYGYFDGKYSTLWNRTDGGWFLTEKGMELAKASIKKHEEVEGICKHMILGLLRGDSGQDFNLATGGCGHCGHC